MLNYYAYKDDTMKYFEKNIAKRNIKMIYGYYREAKK